MECRNGPCEHLEKEHSSRENVSAATSVIAEQGEVKWNSITPIAIAGPKIIVGFHDFPSPPYILYVLELRPLPQPVQVAYLSSGVT